MTANPKKLTVPDFVHGRRILVSAVSMSPVRSTSTVMRVPCEVRPVYVAFFSGGAAAAEAVPIASSPASATSAARPPARPPNVPSLEWSAGVYPHLERSTERDVGMEAQRRVVVDQAQPREAARQLLERELRLELAERGPDAEVDPLAEREVALGVRARGVEAVRLLEHGRVAAGRREPQEQGRALGDVDAAERDRALRPPPPERHRRVVAQRLLDHARDARRVGRDGVPALGHLE